jgi:biopolymer transport protein ExbD
MAFGSFDNNEGSVMSEINMTPLVDVMLVLLIIFIVTVPVMKHSLEIDLPKVSTAPQLDKPDVIKLSVDAAGKYRIDNVPISDEALAKEMNEMATHHPQPVVHIYGDKQVVYERVIGAMAIANKAGIEKVGFVTDPGK